MVVVQSNKTKMMTLAVAIIALQITLLVVYQPLFILFGNSINKTSELAVVKDLVPVAHPRDRLASSALADCLLSSGSYLDAEMCWSVTKDKIALDAVRQLRLLSKEDYDGKFETNLGYSPHRFMMPTFECDALKLQRIGGKYSGSIGDRHFDGPKWVCGEYLEMTDDEECIIFSVGSQGDFAFETDMKSFVKDKCKIFTFDCTGQWTNPSTTFNPWCISDRTFTDEAGRQFMTLNDMMTGVGVSKISVFKLDVEGHEYKVLNALAAQPHHLLPKQLLIEVHFSYILEGEHPLGDRPRKDQNFAGMALELYEQFDSLGYKIALREMNIYNDCCAEYVLIKM